jgi:multidrug resistance efflux pump
MIRRLLIKWFTFDAECHINIRPTHNNGNNKMPITETAPTPIRAPVATASAKLDEAKAEMVKLSSNLEKSKANVKKLNARVAALVTDNAKLREDLDCVVTSKVNDSSQGAAVQSALVMMSSELHFAKITGAKTIDIVKLQMIAQLLNGSQQNLDDLIRIEMD